MWSTFFIWILVRLGFRGWWQIYPTFITGQNGVHLVREISPWSSQVLCIGLAQNLKPILSDDKYWNINPNISAFGMWLICDNTWMYNIQAYAWMYHIQAFAWPQIWPNPIPNPIHGCNTFKILNICMPWNISKYDLIQFQIQYMDLPLSNSRTDASS